MRDLLPCALLAGLLLFPIVVAVVLCITADRVQLALSYRAAQRGFGRYRVPEANGLPSAIQILLSDSTLRSARNLEVMYPSALEPDDPAYYHIAHFVPPEGGVLYSARKLAKLGLVPFARADSIAVYCAPRDTSDLRLWCYDTKSRRAYPMEIEYSKLLADLRATIPV